MFRLCLVSFVFAKKLESALCHLDVVGWDFYTSAWLVVRACRAQRDGWLGDRECGGRGRERLAWKILQRALVNHCGIHSAIRSGLATCLASCALHVTRALALEAPTYSSLRSGVQESRMPIMVVTVTSQKN